MNDETLSAGTGSEAQDPHEPHEPHEIDELYQLFQEGPPPARPVDPAGVPERSRRLLAHEAHMTVTLERFYDTEVSLSVLAEAHQEPLYARKILLHHGHTGRVVQFGIMRFDFRATSDAVRERILEKATPLGRILIEHGTLRRISTHQLVEITPDDEIRRVFAREPGDMSPVWGRLATIFVDERPAVALLEVVAD